METRLLNARQTINNLGQLVENLSTTTARLLDEKARVEKRFTTLERALADDRAILGKSTDAINALVGSAEKSGSFVERTIAEQATTTLRQHAARLRHSADQLAQTRQRIGLERTLFEGLQPRVTTAGDDIKTVSSELEAASVHVIKQRDSITELHTALERDRIGLAKRYDAFGLAVESFRVTQIDMLRRWLLDGPPDGELPSLSIYDVIESGIGTPLPVRSDTSNTMGGDSFGGEGGGYASASQPAYAPMAHAESNPGNQISAEFTQLNRRVRWCLGMLQRLQTFSDESLSEATAWIDSAARWRVQLTNATRSIADQRGALAAVQMEQDMIASTIALIKKQADDTNAAVADTSNYIASQTAKLASITADLKRLSAD
jgi:chromosome segregation ATPase